MACLEVTTTVSSTPANGGNVTQVNAVAWHRVELTVYDDCPPGTYSATGTSLSRGGCLPCLADTYNAAPRQSACTACPEAFPRTLSTGSTNMTDCVTDAGFYRSSTGEAKRCPEGATCNQVGTTVETLNLEPGYWRTGNTSEFLLPCPTPGYCVGGVSGYCRANHTGVFCATCVSGYVHGGALGYCVPCEAAKVAEDQQRFAAIVVAAVLILLLLFAFVQRHELLRAWKRLGLMQKVRDGCGRCRGQRGKTAHEDSIVSASDELPGSSRSWGRSSRSISVRTKTAASVLWRAALALETNTQLKICVSFFQVIGGMSQTFFEVLPSNLHEFINALQLLAADIFFRVDLGCLIPANFYTRLLMSLIAPVVAMAFVLAVEGLAEMWYRYTGSSRSDILRLRRDAFTVFLVLAFL